MKSHKLNIELSFVSQSDADAIMGAIKKVADKTTPESTLSLISEFDKQASESIDSIENTLHIIEGKSAKMLENTEVMRGFVNQVSVLKKQCVGISTEILDLTQGCKTLTEDLNTLYDENKKVLKDSHDEVLQLNGKITETKVSFEACQLIKELGQANLVMLTGGKMTMYSMGHDAFEVAKTWEV